MLFLGGEGKIVEAGATFLSMKKGAAKKRGYGHKVAALSLAGRGREVRSFKIGGATCGGNRCR